MPLNVVGIDRFMLGPLFLLVEDYCAPLMNDDLPADVTPNSPRQNHPFEIVAKADQVLHRVAVSHVLLNNWTGIECLGHIVTRGSDDFHTTLTCRVVWASTGKRGKECMMNVYDPIRVNLHKL